MIRWAATDFRQCCGGNAVTQQREFGFDARRKDDGSGENWDLFVFFGPFVDPTALVAAG
ncbi:hypothetical protein GCM10027089_11320 [Nocardia thraciensis]